LTILQRRVKINTDPQLRRIYAIMVVANLFFALKVMIELTLAIYIVLRLEGTVPFMHRRPCALWSMRFLLTNIIFNVMYMP
jgi:predicted secreted protein